MRRAELERGWVLLEIPRAGSSLVTIRMRLRAGARDDPAGREGLAELSARALRAGTVRRPGSEVEIALDSLGALLATDVRHDATDVEIDLLRSDLEAGLDLLFEIVFTPRFPRREFRRERGILLDDLAGMREDPGDIADLLFASEVYRPHPYHRPIWGTEASVRPLRPVSAASFHRRRYRTDGGLVTVAGDTRGHALPAGISRRLAELAVPPVRPGPATACPSPRPPSGVRVVAAHRPGLHQTHLRIGAPAIPRRHPDRDAVLLANTIFGDSATSRLMENVRGRRGLAYGAASAFEAGRDTGAFVVETQTAHATAGEALARILELLGRFRARGPNPTELRRAVRYRLGLFTIDTETPAELARRHLDAEFLGLGADSVEGFPQRLASLSLATVRDAARKHFPADDILIVAVTDLESPAGRDLARIGPLEARDARSNLPIPGPLPPSAEPAPGATPLQPPPPGR